MSLPHGFADGARNLLLTCGALEPGQRLLILTEDGALGFYDPALAQGVAAVARDLGIRVDLRELPFTPFVSDLPVDLAEMMAEADATLFLARLGDQMRFSPALSALNPIVAYALDPQMLASGFGRAPHDGMIALKTCLQTALSAAQRIHVTCPLGTDFSGPGAAFPEVGGEVTVRRFPLSMVAPVPAAGFSGRIAQAGFIVGTGASYYDPFSVVLEDVLIARFDGTQLLGFDGLPQDCEAANRHYDRVSRLTRTERNHVHSWHAGIHPGCDYNQPAAANFERWSGGAFGNPRLLHFHTCGTVAPGQISLNVVDPTVRLDGVALWDNGRLCPDRIPGGSQVLEDYPALAALFAAPARGVGLGAQGMLCGKVHALS